MKITEITPSFYPDVGGVETVLKETTNRLSSDRIKNVIITCRRSKLIPQYERPNPYQIIYRFDKIAPHNAYHFSMKMIPFLRAYTDKNETIYHIHSYHALTSLNARFFNSKPYVFSLYYHGGGHNPLANLFHIPYKQIAKTILLNAELILAISKTERNTIIKNFPFIDKEKITLLPLGIDKRTIQNLKKRQSEIFTIVYIGRVEEYKGIQYMINAINKRKKNDVKLIIVGTGSYLSNLLEMIRENNLKKQILIDTKTVGKETYKYYEYANIVFSFSYKETFGITIAEALTGNIPCLVPNTGALSEFIDNELCIGIENLNNYKEINEKIDYWMNTKLKPGQYQKKINDWDDYYKELKRNYLSIA